MSRLSKVFTFTRLAFILAFGIASFTHAATLVHTNDLLGDIEPCGCRTNPLGGMARKANMIKRLTDLSLVQVDAGDLLFSSNSLPDLLKDQAELQASYLLKSMNDLHHDVVVPGEKDFALGLKTFDKLRKATQIHFLAANLVMRKGSKAVFEKSVILKRKTAAGKTLRIAVIGIVGDDLPFPVELKALPALAAAKREVAAVRKKADIVVLVTHAGLEKDRELAAHVPGVDVIIGGHTQSFLQEPQTVTQGKHKTIIYQSSFRNQYVGVLPLDPPFEGKDYKLLGLDAGYDSPADAPSDMDKLVVEFKKALGELNTKNDAKIEKITSENAVTTGAKFHTFPKCAECHLKQFDFWRKTRHSLALNALIDKQQYKNKECLTCHTVGMGDPQGFSSVTGLADYKKVPEHAPTADGASAAEEGASLPIDEPVIEALNTEELATYLKAIHDAKSLKDQVKITQLAPEQTVKRSISSMHRSWTPVQCENCHQPGRDHPFSGNYSKKVEKTVCLNCHTAERAPEWYTKSGQPDWTKIEAKRAIVTCPAGNLEDTED